MFTADSGWAVGLGVCPPAEHVKAGKYLYNGKFAEQADNSAVFGGVGTKGAVMTALDQILAKTDEVLTNRMPLKK